jgi:hypothetical protein
MMPAPRLDSWGDYIILRDDILAGGTKQRILPQFLNGPFQEVVYASPAYGYAQIAIAHSCVALGKSATIFVAKRAQLHPRTAQARAAGAQIVQVPYGYLSNVKAKAAGYAAAAGAALLPWGLDFPPFVDALAEFAQSLSIEPAEVCCAAGSGTLTRALQCAWPAADHHAVVVGAKPNAGRAHLHYAPETFECDAHKPPPFPSCSNYDAKIWQFFVRHARPGALYWNVAG